MNNLPDLQGTIEQIESILGIHQKEVDAGRWTHDKNFDPLRDALALLRSYEWVSVKDRLPQSWQEILIVIPDDHSPLGASTWEAKFTDGDEPDFVSTATDGQNDPIIVSSSAIGYGCIVTHWKPLPKPPKVSSDE